MFQLGIKLQLHYVQSLGITLHYVHHFMNILAFNFNNIISSKFKSDDIIMKLSRFVTVFDPKC